VFFSSIRTLLAATGKLGALASLSLLALEAILGPMH